MRAEGQAHVDRIEAALALVRKFLDWDRALRRLDELNARVEDPKLWKNPKEAEAVMRERRRLDAAVGAVKSISSEMENAIEYVELGEVEGDEATVKEGLDALAALAERADADKVQALLAGEADAAPHRLGVVVNVEAVHHAAPAGGLEHGGEHAHHGGLARAVDAEQAEHRATGDGERDAVDRDHFIERLPQLLGEDCRVGHDR